jgi:uncharacterized protein (TIGR00369 family)
MVRAEGVKMTAEEVTAFLDREFPQLLIGGRCYFVDSVERGGATVRVEADARHLRPGGTVSGPTLMSLADLALYAALLASIGPVGLAVTTSLNVNFLRKPEPGPLVGVCRYLKIGKRLAIGEVTIRGAAGGEPVAHATGTYSIPAG